MNIELTLTEFNDLFCSISNLVKENKSNLKKAKKENSNYTQYLKKKLDRSEALYDKIKYALYERGFSTYTKEDLVQAKDRRLGNL